jgi:mono/diheme cytochrome c family protein
MRFECKLSLLALVAFVFSGSALAADKATEELYVAKCAKCHGNDGVATAVGKKLGAKDFSDPEVMKASEKEMTEVTAAGRKKMPAYDKKLKADELKALVAYVRELGKAKK